MDKSRRVVMTTKGEQLFDAHLSIYVNRSKESFVLSEHDHDFVEICYVSEGTGTHYIENQAISVKKGDLFYIPIGVYMRAHLDETLTLPIISKFINVGERQLQRLIKKATGQTFIQWLQGERISKSCELLQQTNEKVSEIASQVGFQDLKHFHRLFKSKTGVTPGLYRKSFEIIKCLAVTD